MEIYLADIQQFEGNLSALDAEENSRYADSRKFQPRDGFRRDAAPRFARLDSNETPKNRPAKPEVFPFDPNTASESDLERLGLPPHTIRGIANYRNKGGKFRTAADFKKIYTLSEADFLRLEPHIRINSENAKTAINKGFQVDINAATAEDFEKMRGIGANYANRIIKYRDQLGGFVRVEQIGEVYGMPDSTFQRILPQLTCPNPNPKRLALNTASGAELNAHPYLRGGKGYALEKWRMKNGKFTSLETLKTLPALDDGQNTPAKIAPYLTLD